MRKGRKSTGNLVEQVESREVEYVYEKACEYYSTEQKCSLKSFIIRKLKEEGYLDYFNEQRWATPIARDYKGHTSDHKSRGYGETLPDQVER